MTDFPTLSYTSTSEIPTPLIYMKPQKGTHFVGGGGGASRISHYRENPLGSVTRIGHFEELETGSVLCWGASWDYFEDGTCLPVTKSFRKIRLGSNYLNNFLGRSIKRKISRSNGTSEKVVLFCHTEKLLNKPFLELSKNSTSHQPQRCPLRLIKVTKRYFRRLAR